MLIYQTFEYGLYVVFGNPEVHRELTKLFDMRYVTNEE